MMMQSKIKKNKKSFLRSLRNFCISILVLVILALAAGAAYIWYMGRNDDNRFNSMQTGETVKAPTIEAGKVDENAPVGVALQMLSSPIVPGSEASISVRTNREAKCTIKAEYNKVAVVNSAFIEKTANEFGGVDWTWMVDSSAPIGKWPVTVTCSKNAKSGMYIADLEIVKSL